MASCVLLWLLYCCIVVVGVVVVCSSFLPVFSFPSTSSAKRKKAASPHPERTNLCFFLAAVGISFCVSSILLLLGGLILR